MRKLLDNINSVLTLMKVTKGAWGPTTVFRILYYSRVKFLSPSGIHFFDAKKKPKKQTNKQTNKTKQKPNQLGHFLAN